LNMKTNYVLRVCLALFCLLELSILMHFYFIHLDSPNGVDYSPMRHFFATKHAIFIGLVKDAAATLPSLLSELDEVSNYFNHSTFIFFESNSEDNTLRVLQDWAIKAINDSKTTKMILSGDALVHDLFNTSADEMDTLYREDRYTMYRNMLLHYAKQQVRRYPGSAKDTFLIMVDLDIPSITNLGKSIPFILNEVHIGVAVNDMNIICLNGLASWYKMRMRDTYATINMDNVWYRQLAITPGIAAAWQKFKHIIYEPVISPSWLHRDAFRFVRVKSCFGGVAFYYSLQQVIDSACKYLSFMELKRNARDKSGNHNDVYNSSFIVNNAYAYRRNKTCEHIPFNMCLTNHHLQASISTHSKFCYHNI